ncbi:MAG TPA: hypothetical protein V6C88_21650 [Chroococcidiopsis sp.]
MLHSERIESVKAGLTGGGAIALAVVAIAVVQTGLAANLPIDSGVLPFVLGAPFALGTLEGWLSGAIAVLAGFLFGVTYRYVVRTDSNPHLKTGAVMAFGLVRGLAQVDVGVSLGSETWLLPVFVVESVGLFAIARFTVDWAMQRGWVNPFGAAGDTVNAEPTATGNLHPAQATTRSLLD